MWFSFSTYLGSRINEANASNDAAAFPPSRLDSVPRPSSSRPNAPEKSEEKIAGLTINDSVASSSAAERDKPRGRPYSYKDYKLKPNVVYARCEADADRVVETLKGYVCPSAVEALHDRSDRPLGFDMEWKAIMRKGSPRIEHRTAVIQMCDSETILIAQVSAMKSTSFEFCHRLSGLTVVLD